MTRVNEGSSHPGYSLSRGLSEAVIKGGDMLVIVKTLMRQSVVMFGGVEGGGGVGQTQDTGNKRRSQLSPP